MVFRLELLVGSVYIGEGGIIVGEIFSQKVSVGWMRLSSLLHGLLLHSFCRDLIGGKQVRDQELLRIISRH